MEGVTLLVGVAAAVATFFLTPVAGLIIYIALLAWYPTFLSIKIGTVDFTVCRILILAIYANLFLFTNLAKGFRFIWLDRLIILYFLAQVSAGLMTTTPLILLENRAGAVFDTVLPYFAVRIILTNKRGYLILLKGILFSALPLAVLGIYQCLSGHNFLSFVPGYFNELDQRFGFYRATIAFSVSIMFGLYFAMLGPVCTALFATAGKNKWFYGFALVLMAVGVFSSMSSGPFLSAMLSAAFIAAFSFRRFWKPIVLMLVVACGMVEVISNRHFYDVLGGFTFNPKTAWYRSKLVDVAVMQGGMAGHWIAGYGFEEPGWSEKIDHRDRTDIVNHYLLILARFGIIGLIPFAAILAAVVNNLRNSFRRSISGEDKWLIWSLAGTLFGLSVTMFSVSLFGPPKTILYILFGFCGIIPRIVKETNCQLLTAGLQYHPPLIGRRNLPVTAYGASFKTA